MLETVAPNTTEKMIFTTSHFGEAPIIAPVVETQTTIAPTEQSTVPIGEQAAAVETTTTTEEVVVEENVSKFDMGELGGEEQGLTTQETKPQIQSPQISWEDAIKNIDKKEILKKIGLDDFVIGLNEHLDNGGDAVDYLNAKAVDWTKVDDVNVLLADLKVEYPTASQQQLEKLLNKKYSQNDIDDPEDKEIGLLQMQSDANKKRQEKIIQQQKFSTPKAKGQQVVDVQSEVEKELQKQQQLQAIENQKLVEYYQTHELTKSLNDSKRVAVNIGDDKQFVFEVTKPELVTRAITDGDFWQRIISTNPQEADVTKLIPDIAKQQRLALVAMNPNYEKDLVNYGKSLGLKAIVEEGQNAKRPIATSPTAQHDDEKSAAQRARASTYGG